MAGWYNNTRRYRSDNTALYWADRVKSDLLDLIDNSITLNVPSGHYRPINFYVDSNTGRLVVEFEDEPAE